jgi:hypothetical protein
MPQLPGTVWGGYADVIARWKQPVETNRHASSEALQNKVEGLDTITSQPVSKGAKVTVITSRTCDHWI